MRRLRTIDDLYSDVKDYDLVITNDAALETALNSRITVPRIGQFCMTPRHIAYLLAPKEMGLPVAKDMTIIAAVREDTGYDLRYIYSEIKNFREIRRHTAEVRKHLNTRRSARVYDSYESLPTVERVMANFDPENSEFFRGKRVAMIGVELFDDLDKHFIPLDADFFDIFADDGYTIPEIRVVGNDRQLAENAVDLVDPEKADDFAIVLNATAPIADAVRAALYRRRLPFINRMDVKDMAPIRDYLSFLTHSFNYETVRVRQVKELFSAYNGFILPGAEEYLLSRQDGEVLRQHAKELKEIMRRVCHEGMTFGEVRDEICLRSTKMHVTNLLKDLNLEDKVVTPGELANLRYAVENIGDLTNTEQRKLEETTGVLLADCTKSVYVDRPVVIYLGMGQDWDVRVVGKRYLDPEDENDRNAARLEALLQQGERRVYMVNTTKNGKEAHPALTFSSIERDDDGKKKPCPGFADICSKVTVGRWKVPQDSETIALGQTDVDSDKEFDAPFSKTTYNAFRYCPRKYMFASVLRDSDKTYTVFGNLIHEFAELYACHPDAVRQTGEGRIVDMISERYAGLSSPSMEPLDRDRITLAVRNVMSYMDRNSIMMTDLVDSNSSRKSPNGLMTELGLDACSPSCEHDHRGSAHPLHGIFDLYNDGVVVDYKSGRMKGASDIAKAMSGDSDEPEFQPLMYLALSLQEPDSKGRFDQFYVMGNDVDSLRDGYDIMSNVVTVRVSDSDLMSAAMGSADYMETLRQNVRSEYQDKLEDIMEALRTCGVPDPEKWREDESVVGSAISAIGGKDNKTVRTNMGRAIGKIADTLKGGIARGRSEIVIPRSTLDSFLRQLDSDHAVAVRMSRTEFPALPLKDCKKCDYREACTLAVMGVSGGDEDE